jgi:protein-L-isoaspartate(D-aspartate) O-methyltransferase
MVDEQLRCRGIIDKNVLAAMLAVERHRFVPAKLQTFAYADRPLPVGSDQTISQPYIVAYMCQVLNLSGSERVLEIGTGSGYETAVLTFLAREVYTIEIREELCRSAQKTLQRYKTEHLHFKLGDGLSGWPEAAPFDAIILSASPREIPEILLEQLTPDGKLVAPIGQPGEQTLVLVESTPNGWKRTNLMSVAFVQAKRDDSHEA